MIRAPEFNKVVDVLIGMQFGSEGKGKIVNVIANDYAAAVRVGAPNAGHTIYFGEKEYKMQTIPCAWINPSCKLYIGPGGLINKDILDRELLNVPLRVLDRLFIDNNAGIVTHEDAEAEKAGHMYERIGSTTEGIGEAMARRIKRRFDGGESLPIAGQQPDLLPHIANVAALLNEHVDRSESVLVEGTQGFGLSLNHGYYPYVTSRDVAASSVLGECGLSPNVVRNVIGVFRTYPIRVHGNSGPMGAREMTWEEVAKESGYAHLEERTTVTKRVRRVSQINWELLKQAVLVNRPNVLALTFADYVTCEDRGVSRWGDLTEKTKSFVLEAERRLGVPIGYVSTGPLPQHVMKLPW